jgi:hypothetical protein
MRKAGFMIGLWICLAFPYQALAGAHRYNDRKDENNFADTDAVCEIQINGRTHVQGTYDNANGLLVISHVDGRSEIILKGKCKAVVVRNINGQSLIDIAELQVGEGGITVEKMDGQSRIFCWTKGEITVDHAEGQCSILYKTGAKSAKCRTPLGEFKFIELK